MSRQRNDILSDLRLANFNKEPLKRRFELLLELDADREGANKDDIIAHADKRLIEMCDGIRHISEDDTESHATDIIELYNEYERYNSHPVISRALRQSLRSVYEGIIQPYKVVVDKVDEGNLGELRCLFEQVPQVDWGTEDAFQQANRAITDYEKIRQRCDKTKWYIQRRQAQAEELKREINSTIEGIKLEELRRRFEQVPGVDWSSDGAYQQGTKALEDYGNILQELKTEWHTSKEQARKLEDIITTKFKEIEAKTIQARRKRS